MRMSLAIVTGASRGLGLALTQSLHGRGWELVVDGRDPDALGAATRELERVTGLAGDITDPEHRRAMVDAAKGRSIDLVVNNASRLGPSPRLPLADHPVDELARIYETNVVAPLALVQLALPQLAPAAAIVNVSSDAAVETYPAWGGYGSSKAALDHLTLVLAAENPGLRVYAVDPGDMRTQMHQDAFPGEDISDRPPPEDSVPGLLSLIEGTLPSGRYRAADVGTAGSS